MAKYCIQIPFGEIRAKSYRSLKEKCFYERNFWQGIGPEQRSDFFSGVLNQNWGGEQFNYIQKASQLWSSVCQRLEATDGRSFSGEFEEIKEIIESANASLPWSGSRLGSAVKELWERNKFEANALLFAYATMQLKGPARRLKGGSEEAGYRAMAFALYYSFTAADMIADSSLEGVRREELIAEEISEELALLSEETNHKIAESEKSAAKFSEEISDRAKSLYLHHLGRIRAANLQERKAYEKRVSDEEEALRRRVDQFESLRATYEAHLRIEHPAKLWSERQELHDGNSTRAWEHFSWAAFVFLAACGSIVLLGGDWIAGSFIKSGCILGWEVECKGISPKGPLVVAVVLTVMTLGLWYLRLQMKLFLSERHLALDARERSAFAETYLSLIKNASISGEQEVVIMQSLFRPTQDGIIQDDNGPDFAVAGLLAKALDRK